MDIKTWIGSWESFENYIYSTDKLMVNTWEEAEQKSKAHPGLAKMFKDGCVEFCKNSCTTVTEKNPNGVYGMEITETEDSIEIERVLENQNIS